MSNNLPMETNDGIVSKIKNFFKKLFVKPQKNQLDFIESTEEEKENIIVPNSEIFSKNLNENLEKNKVNVASDFVREREKDEVIDKLIKKPELLDEININTLEKIVEYYEKRVEAKRKLA